MKDYDAYDSSQVIQKNYVSQIERESFTSKPGALSEFPPDAEYIKNNGWPKRVLTKWSLSLLCEGNQTRPPQNMPL